MHATVRKRVCDEDGRPVGIAHSNPMLDSRKYEVEYLDGHVEELTANQIAENLMAQVDKEGRRQMMLMSIMDHRTLHDAIPKSQGTYVNSYGVKRQKTTTRGWELVVEWRDGSSDGVSLKDLKDAYPVEHAVYAKGNSLEDEPAFAWWVLSYVLRKQNRILQRSRLSIGHVHTSMASEFQRILWRQLRSTRKMKIPCGWMQSNSRCKTSALHSESLMEIQIL